jgi:hypothetical protein
MLGLLAWASRSLIAGMIGLIKYLSGVGIGACHELVVAPDERYLGRPSSR